MAKFSLCIEPVLTDYDFCDRIKIAAEIGYDAIEFWDPSDKDLPAIADAAAKNNVDVATVSYTHLTLPTNSRV